MAMRAPRSGDVRPRVVARPVYEDFKPMFEWKQDQSADLLIVYLPGFMKEYLKVTIEGKNTVRVRGERLLAGNKWSRFQEDYQIPEHCNATGIRAKFERGILTVTLPRKTNNIIPQAEVPPPKMEPKTNQEALSPKEAITKPIPQRTTDAAATSQTEKDQKSNTNTIPQKGNNYQEFERSKPQNVKSEEKIHQGVVKKDDELTSESKGKTKEETKSMVEEEKKEPKHESVSEKIKGKTSEIKGKGGEFGRRFAEDLEEGKRNMEKALKESIEGISRNVAKRKTEKDESLEEKISKETSKSSTSDNKDSEESKLEYYYKKMVMGKKEERQLLVNMGVAVLVIVALGAYVSYTYGSSAKAKH